MSDKVRGHPWQDYSWDFWNPEANPIDSNPPRALKISLCTTVMNRLHDLKLTLPRNLIDNAHYPNVEHVILDYNSTDGLGEWIKDNYMNEIETGNLVYARTTEPEHYTMSHSRNVAFEVASGDIVNNLDADNYTGRDFCHLINGLAHVRPERAAFVKGKRMMHGRIGFYKKEWEAIGGYDEDLHSYGFDDHNLLYRMMLTDCQLMWWGYFGPQHSERIVTSRQDKMTHMANKNRRWTEAENKRLTYENLDKGELRANIGKHWGKATLTRNFKEEISV